MDLLIDPHQVLRRCHRRNKTKIFLKGFRLEMQDKTYGVMSWNWMRRNWDIAKCFVCILEDGSTTVAITVGSSSTGKVFGEDDEYFTGPVAEITRHPTKGPVLVGYKEARKIWLNGSPEKIYGFRSYDFIYTMTFTFHAREHKNKGYMAKLCQKKDGTYIIVSHISELPTDEFEKIGYIDMCRYKDSECMGEMMKIVRDVSAREAYDNWCVCELKE